VRYLSDVNLRAVLSVLVGRAGGRVDITNAELYDAMLPDHGEEEIFSVTETPTGLRLSIMTGEPRDPGPDGRPDDRRGRVSD
jgi:hypothetical protein